MFITPAFVFVHLHKSGGTFVNRFLRTFFPDGQRMNWHLPRAYMPVAARGLPVLGVVRNPWDYYVSWFTFQSGMRPEQQNAIYRVASDGGNLGFPRTIENLSNLCENKDQILEIRAQLPDAFMDQGINLTKRCVDPLLGSGLGFYSFLFKRMFGLSPLDLGVAADNITFARMESLRTDLLDFLSRFGVQVTPAMRDFLLHSEKVNTTQHNPYPAYYEPRLRDLVAMRDGDLIRRFGYVF